MLKKILSGSQKGTDQTDDIEIFVEEILSELPLKEKASMANMNKEAVEVIQSVFDLYIKNKIGSESEEEYTVIMKALWERLQETHKLRAIK